MTSEKVTCSLPQMLQGLTDKKFSPLDFLGRGSLSERIISLALGEVSLVGGDEHREDWQRLIESLAGVDVSGLNVVVFGGGTGLSNIVGGDSRRPEWQHNPFIGLKEIFPNLHSIVCVTDDGGSTGEMLKDFPLVALGDLRHVLLSSVRSGNLKEQYQLNERGAAAVAAKLHTLFNHRFSSCPSSAEQLWGDIGIEPDSLPPGLGGYLSELVNRLFTDQRMIPTLHRPQCLGNLLLAAAIYGKLPTFFRTAELFANQKRVQTATIEGLSDLSLVIGAGEQAVLPCTTTPAQLQLLYGNGVLVTSESKSGLAKRGYPVERVQVMFSDDPLLPDEVADYIRGADIIIMAPGSLYTSIIPILQVPGMADLIRQNSNALKLLAANIWVQKGETDATRDAPDRKFHVSDLILAYNHNISGGIQGLFSHVLTLDLADISGSVLQNYAIEKKEPIYIDSSRVRELGFEPVQACIFSRQTLQQRKVIQHDPGSFAQVVQVLWGLRSAGFLAMPTAGSEELPVREIATQVRQDHLLPCMCYEEVSKQLAGIEFSRLTLRTGTSELLAEADCEQLIYAVSEIIWRHPDIHPDHLQNIRAVCLVDTDCWQRCQQWDNVFSFYDADEGCIKIRSDQASNLHRLEMAFLVGLGQSLLGNYVLEKRMDDVLYQGQQVGRIYCLTVREKHHLRCFLSAKELDTYLLLSRMFPTPEQSRYYTRIVNGEEGFTPPGLLFGLLFAWYLDNRFAPNIDYKMSIMKNKLSYLIPEQVRLVQRREKLIHFFRENVFRSQL